MVKGVVETAPYSSRTTKERNTATS